MSKQKTIAVVFARAWRGYNKGETAGFDQETAEALHEAGIVESEAEDSSRRARPKSDGGKKAESSPPEDPSKGTEPAGGGTPPDDNARP
jgi:hypothetical protein